MYIFIYVYTSVDLSIKWTESTFESIVTAESTWRGSIIFVPYLQQDQVT